MELAALAYPFTLGSVAAFNPCGFAMLPAFVSYFLATEGDAADAEPENASWVRRAGRALGVGLALTAGFVVLFTIAGGIISAGGQALITGVPWLGVLIGLLFVALGLWLLAGRQLSVPALPSPQVTRRRSIGGMFLFGAAYGLVSLTCTLPLFLGVVGSALTQSGLLGAVGQFVAYAAGMGAVMVAIALSLALFEGVMLTRLRQLTPYVTRLGALALVGVGGYMVYYWLDTIALMRG